MDKAEYYDRILIMVDGRIEALDTPSELVKIYNTADINNVFIKIARDPGLRSKEHKS